MRKRTGNPWISNSEYGALPQFTVNLIVRSIDLALEFYRKVLRPHRARKTATVAGRGAGRPEAICSA